MPSQFGVASDKLIELRHPLEVETGSGDVFAKLSWSNLEATRREGCDRLATSEIAVPDERAALDAEISDGLFALALAYRNQSDLLKKRLKTKTKNKTVKKKKVVKEVQSPTKKSKRKHSTKAIGRKRRS